MYLTHNVSGIDSTPIFWCFVVIVLTYFYFFVLCENSDDSWEQI